MKLHPTPLLRRIRAGFSLAEVTIATGITAVAMTTLLGLIPHGITDIKKAGDIAAEARISEHILGSLTQAAWQDADGRDVLATKFDHQRFYFDDQGIALADSDAPGTDLAYVAEVRVPAQDITLSSSGPAPEGAANDPYLRRVTLKFASVPRQDFDFDKALPISYRSRTTLIARTGN